MNAIAGAILVVAAAISLIPAVVLPDSGFELGAMILCPIGAFGLVYVAIGLLGRTKPRHSQMMPQPPWEETT